MRPHLKSIVIGWLIVCFSALGAAAQDETNMPVKPAGPRYHTGIYHPRPPRKPPARQSAYVGFAGGINNPTGFIGLQIDFAVAKSVSVCLSGGLSTWGVKGGLEARYYLKPFHRGWAGIAGLTINTGLRNTRIKGVETIRGDEIVTVTLKPQPAAILGVAHFFNLGRRGVNRFHLQLGYAIPLSSPDFDLDQYSTPLTEKGRQQILSLAPGGLNFGLGFSFGTGTENRHPRR